MFPLKIKSAQSQRSNTLKTHSSTAAAQSFIVITKAYKTKSALLPDKNAHLGDYIL